MAGQSETIIARVLSELPEIPSYDEHRENLREFQTVSHDFKEARCNCQKKVAQFLHEFIQFMQTYSWNEAKTAEYHNVVNLLNASGLQNIRNNVESKRSRGEYRYLTGA